MPESGAPDNALILPDRSTSVNNSLFAADGRQRLLIKLLLGL